MKKLIFFGVLIFLCNGVFAISGVSPGSYEINFTPGYRGQFEFEFVLDGAKADLNVEGNLARYVSLDKESILGRERVVVLLDLGLEIDSPGINQIKIVAGDVMGVIKVKVPYPEKFVELELSAPNVNVGEGLNLNLKAFSRGNNSVVVEPKIEIYKDDELIETIEMGSEEITSREFQEFSFLLNTSNYSGGDYLAVAFVDYGERVENLFRLGECFVRILNYTIEFQENEVCRFEIGVESLWNNDLNDLYAEVNVIEFDDVKFVSPVVGLKAWKKEVLIGFLDTRKVAGYSPKVEIVLYYNGKTSSEIVELKILKGFDYVFWSVFIGFLIVIGFLIWRLRIFVEKIKHNSKK